MSTTPPAQPHQPVWFAYMAKFVTAATGAISLAIAEGLIEGTAAKWAAIIIGALTAAGVYVVPNHLPHSNTQPPP